METEWQFVVMKRVTDSVINPRFVKVYQLVEEGIGDWRRPLFIGSVNAPPTVIELGPSY